jgi:outer membrane protein assembly factor BamA
LEDSYDRLFGGAVRQYAIVDNVRDARRFKWCIALLGALLLWLTPGLSAQQTESASPPEQDTDLPDVIRAWRHKDPPPEPQPGHKSIVVAPAIGSNPSAGFFIGAAGQMTMFRGDPSTTRITAGIASVTISSKKQVVFNVRFDSFSDGNRWLIEGDNRFQSTSQNIYGFGSDTPSSAATSTDYGFVRLHETISRRVAADVYLGGGILFDSHTNVQPSDPADPSWPTSPYIAYSEQHGLPTGGQQSAGFSLNLLLNHRDSDINARRGWMLSGQYRWLFDGLLGGDSPWQELVADARAYVPIDSDGRHRLAFWSYASLVTRGVAPYFDAPATVMDTYGRSARGYQDGRYRGERLVYGEAEFRGPLMSNGLLGVVGFATVTSVSNSQTGERLFDSVAPSAGGGLRLLLSKRSRTNLCLDFAWGKHGARGTYLAIQDAF